MNQKLTISKGMVWNEDGRVVFVVTEDATQQDERAVLLSNELIPAVEEFIDNANSGNFKPKTTIKKFEDIMKKYA